MNPARSFPIALHVMAIAILASGFIGNMLSLSAAKSVASLERTNEVMLADLSVGVVGINAG